MNKWVKYKLTKRPFKNAKGEIVDITGRRNRPTMDEFSGGGCDYPVLPTYSDRCEGDNKETDRILMLLVDDKEKEIAVENPLEELKAIGLLADATLDDKLTIVRPDLDYIGS